MPRATRTQVLAARRIAVLGVTGAGKSTAARALAEVIGGRPIDADNEIRWADAAVHGPWSIRSEEEQCAIAERLTAEPAWAIAAVPGVVEDIVGPRLDLAVVLDYAPALTLSRLLRRTARRILTAEPVCNGNRETLAEALGPDSIIRWWAGTVRERHAEALRLLAAPDGVPVLRLTETRQLDSLLGLLGAAR